WSRMYAMDLGPAEAVVNFFSQPWAIAAYIMVMLVPNFFFRVLPGSLVYFVVGIILVLALKSGLA
ncbi:MAG: hypothetical protein V1835_06990, partial [Candidatus Micrarchaeota archaeon]